VAISGNLRIPEAVTMDAVEFMTLAEVAILLRIGERTAYDLARNRRIPAAKVGNQWRIRRRDLDAWVDQGGEAAPTGHGS
jgi:excisionase family DNA binding protein